MDFVNALVEVVKSTQMNVMIGLLIAALVLGVAAAIKDKSFQWGKFGDFVPDKIWPLIAWVVVAALAGLSGEWSSIGALVYAGVIAIYTKGILGSVKTLTGLDIPDAISK
jgi:hypothetical protein